MTSSQQGETAALLAALDELTYLQFQFRHIDERPESIIQRHIDLLHRYNQVKDATQSLIGKYAQLKSLQIAAVHEQLGLPLKDE